MHKALTVSLVIFIVSFAQPAFSQYYKLECEIKNYGPNYTTGKARRVAECFVPNKSTHIIFGKQSYHIEFRDFGWISHPKNRIYFSYPQKDTNGTRLVLNYTYLTKNNIMNAKSYSPPGFYHLDAFGKCKTRTLERSQATKYFEDS